MRTREGIRFSYLKNIARSPAHYLYHLQNPIVATAPMRMGSLGHCLLLGGEYHVFDGIRRGKAWDAFVADHDPDDLIVTPDEVAHAKAMTDHVRKNPLAMAALEGDHEVELFRDFAGHKLGGRLDVIGDDFITDLKFTHESSPARFPWQLRKMHYDSQGDYYRELALANGRTVKNVRIVACEMKPPFAVTVFRLMPRQLEAGAMKWRGWLETLLTCQASNHWPEYSDCEVDVDIPDEDETFGLTGLEDESEAA